LQGDDGIECGGGNEIDDRQEKAGDAYEAESVQRQLKLWMDLIEAVSRVLVAALIFNDSQQKRTLKTVGLCLLKTPRSVLRRMRKR